jgi:2-keto-4-pentenoate hydratase
MNLEYKQAAAHLLAAHLEMRSPTRFAGEWEMNGLADAYAVQAALVEQMLPAYGRRVGYKIGLTSARMQKMCSIDHPIAGVVLEKRLCSSGARLSLSSLMHLGIEFEICVRLGRSLAPREQPYELDDVAQAVDAVAPAFEVVDDRNSAYPLDLICLVADNAWNDGLVVGQFQPSWPDLAAARGVVECNGKTIDEGHGRDVLGHPFEPLRWLANHLRTQGQTLQAGELVSTGSLVNTRFPAAGEHYKFSVEGVGFVEVSFEP